MSLTQQLTFEASRIGKAPNGKKCEVEISEDGNIRKCKNSAYLFVKNESGIHYYCWHHSRDSWKEVLETKRLFGGR